MMQTKRDAKQYDIIFDVKNIGRENNCLSFLVGRSGFLVTIATTTSRGKTCRQRHLYHYMRIVCIAYQYHIIISYF